LLDFPSASRAGGNVMADDQGDILIDWRLVADAARDDQRPGGERQNRADRSRRRRSASYAFPVEPPPGQLAFDFGPSFNAVSDGAPRIPATRAPVVRPAHSAEMESQLLPFPLARRRPLVAKLIAEVEAASTMEAGENLLRGRLARLGRGLRRKHIPEEIVAGEIGGLEAAVHTALRKHVGRLADG
jgi:hypothetical protein